MFGPPITPVSEIKSIHLDRPCKVCGQIPLFYLKSRIEKQDFTCQKCLNLKRDKWRKKKTLKKLKPVISQKEDLANQLGLFDV